jgi:hypothetical protein
LRIAERATWNVRFGQLPTFDRTRGISTLPSEADIGAIFRDVSFGPILLQKSAAANGLSVILFNGDRL